MSITQPDFLEQDRPAAGALAAASIPAAGAATALAPVMPRNASAGPQDASGVLRDASGVHDYARRMAFLTELDSQTWIARYSSAERLGDPGAVGSPAAYAAWLRRIAAAWSVVPMPTTAQAASVWAFSAISPLSLDAMGQVEADLRELALAGGGPRTSVTTRQPITAAVTQAPLEDVDAAYVAGAVYAAVVTAQEVAVLAADVEHLSATACRTPLPQHYVRHCTQLAAVRSIVRRELAQWANTAGPDAAERVVLAARMLTEHLSAALTHGSRPGW